MIDTPTLPGQARRARPLGRLLDTLASWLAVAGGVVLVAITLLSAYSITMRSLFGEPFLGDVELVQMGCGIAVVCFLPLCQLRRGNVIVDAFTLHVGVRTRACLDVVGSLLMAACAALLAWRSVIGTFDTQQSFEESIILGIPMWWSMVPFAPAFALFAVVSLYTAWLDFHHEGGQP
jgi:TRAP-type C4-dicarboxylate transport system permease small subunit